MQYILLHTSFHGKDIHVKGAAMSVSIKSAASEENNSTPQKHHVFFDVETTGLGRFSIYCINIFSNFLDTSHTLFKVYLS